MTQLDAILEPLFTATDPAVMGRNALAATLPIAFLDDVYGAKSYEDVLDAYAHWTQRIIGSENCSVALRGENDTLVLKSLSGQVTQSEVAARTISGSSIGAVYRRQKGLFIPDLSMIPHPAAQSAFDNGFLTAYIAPIVSGSKCFGTFSATFRVQSAQPSIVMTLIEAMARCMGAQLMLFDQMSTLEELARTDPLTGTRNRRAFDEETPRSWANWKTKKEPFALLALDIDLFKKINDEHGHAVGDEILRQLANRVMENTRGSDVVFRLGGEEFGVLLPATAFKRSLRVAERIHEAIRQRPFVVDDLILPVTASFGVTEIDRADMSTADVINRADEALYLAKRSGRDQIVRASAEQEFVA